MSERKSSVARANSSACCGSWNDVIELRNDSASSWTDAIRYSRDCVRPEATPRMACTAPVLRVLLDCLTSRLETPAASTTCHYPAPPDYALQPSPEGIYPNRVPAGNIVADREQQ